MLVDLRPKGLTGKEAEAILGEAHMTCNKNGIPNDPQKPMVTSGVFVCGSRGFYHGDLTNHCPAANEQPHPWWSFRGVTQLLRDGRVDA